jgi:hypothetical protein
MKYLKTMVLVSLLFAFCRGKEHENKIPIDKMKVVVWQLMQADELYGRQVVLDSSWKAQRKNVQFYQQIFDFNKVDRKHFYDQIDYLEAHPTEFKVLMDSVDALSKREKNEALKH